MTSATPDLPGRADPGPTRVAVMGAGSWGTAFATVLADAGCSVALWSHHADQAEAINRERVNAAFFPDLRLPDAIRAYADAQEAMEGAGSWCSRSRRRPSGRTWRAGPSRPTPLVSLAKGIEVGTGLRMSQLIAQVTGIGEDRIAVVSGPNLAREIAEGQPAATVVACTSPADRGGASGAPATRPGSGRTPTPTWSGCELGGATKNVIALAVGIAIGFGLGDNSTASVITRGLAETIRLGVELGAEPYTFSGLAGLGDLVATCSSPLSRNRTFGEALGRGRTVAEIAASTRQVAEGVKSCSSIRQLALDHHIEMPIVEAVDAVIAEKLTPRDMIDALMARSAKPERY